jgi:hypothetical protein
MPLHQNHRQVQGAVRSQNGLPLFCNPLVLFFLNWTAMLAALSIHVTYVSYPGMALPVELCALSTASMLCGYFVTVMLVRRRATSPQPARFALDATQLVRLNVVLCAIAIIIVAFNWAAEGAPPALGDPSSYLTYGRFRQLLFPILTVITVNAFLDPSRVRRLIFASFGFLGLAIYITRGLMVVTLLEVFFVVALKSTMSKQKLYGLCAIGAAVTIAGATILGDIRTAHVVFLDFLQIREKYFEWPMASLWLTSYVSIPLSNLCWILKTVPYHGPTLAFLYPLLPSFIAPLDPHIAIHNDLRIIDGASTYLSVYALDFSYFGAFVPNVILGSACAWIRGRGLPRHFLISALFLTCISFICFSDMFSPLSTVVQVMLLTIVQRRCIRWEPAIEGGLRPG